MVTMLCRLYGSDVQLDTRFFLVFDTIIVGWQMPFNLHRLDVIVRVVLAVNELLPLGRIVSIYFGCGMAHIFVHAATFLLIISRRNGAHSCACVCVSAWAWSKLKALNRWISNTYYHYPLVILGAGVLCRKCDQFGHHFVYGLQAIRPMQIIIIIIVIVSSLWRTKALYSMHHPRLCARNEWAKCKHCWANAHNTIPFIHTKIRNANIAGMNGARFSHQIN